MHERCTAEYTSLLDKLEGFGGVLAQCARSFCEPLLAVSCVFILKCLHQLRLLHKDTCDTSGLCPHHHGTAPPVAGYWYCRRGNTAGQAVVDF